MDQASALAIGTACALQHVSAPVVQTPLRPSYSECTSYGCGDFVGVVTRSVLDELARRGDGLSQQHVASALRELVATLFAMAEETAPPRFFLSSLDPGVGKTTTLIHFVRHLLRSAEHQHVGVLLCFSRLEEISRVVEELDLVEADFAVFTKDEKINELSPTLPREARVLLTTHAMVKSRCRDLRFQDVDAFKFQGKVRTVRVWDEAMLPYELVSVSTDKLAALRAPLRSSFPSLAHLVERLEEQLKASGGKGTFTWPDVAEITGHEFLQVKRGLQDAQVKSLDAIYALSGRCVLLRKASNTSPVITALDIRDAIPDDLAPMVVLDASGRVRKMYDQWGRTTGKLERLPSAVRSYRNLTVHVMDRGSGKTAWMRHGADLAQQIAQLIDSKPNEEWLVIYHKGVDNDGIPDMIKGLLATSPGRVSFLNWGKHQGTNAFRYVQNVVLASLNNYAETDYELAARYCNDIANEEEIAQALVDKIRVGEHQHHILQALCRASVRQGNGSECGPCNAYIIAPTRSGVRKLIPQVFPGCKVKTWGASKAKAKGRVQQGLAYLKAYFDKNPCEPLLFSELQEALGIKTSSNFRRTIRQHKTFMDELRTMGVTETTVGNYSHRNAFAQVTQHLTPIEGASYTVEI